MDKSEYKLRAEEIKDLISRGEYAQAAEIADTIDWRRVKSVMMLCTISDLYKINRRYEDARDMLLLAYERRPGGRTICYSLCELSIKMEEYVQAIEYYKEFVQVAPKDSGRYILQYKLYEGRELPMGCGFDAFTDKTYAAYYETAEHVQGAEDEQVRENRRLLYYAMIDAGFTNLPSEWWHYDYGDRFWAYYMRKPAIYEGVFTREEIHG